MASYIYPRTFLCMQTVLTITMEWLAVPRVTARLRVTISQGFVPSAKMGGRVSPASQVSHMSGADSRFAPSQWETILLCNDVSHWLGANQESTPHERYDEQLIHADTLHSDRLWWARCPTKCQYNVESVSMSWGHNVGAEIHLPLQ